MILPVYSILVRPYPKYCIHLWGIPAQEGCLEQTQERAMKVIRGLEQFFYEDRLKEMGLEKRMLQGDLIAAFQFIKGPDKRDGRRFLSGPVVTGQVIVLN